MNVTLEKVSKPLAPTCPDWQALCVPDLDCNGSLRLFTEGDNLHEAMISAIEAAQRSIRKARIEQTDPGRCANSDRNSSGS
jgi:hypothetical protein